LGSINELREKGESRGSKRRKVGSEAKEVIKGKKNPIMFDTVRSKKNLGKTFEGEG